MKVMDLDDLDFFKKHTHSEVVRLRNARIKRVDKEREQEEKRRKDQEAKQRRAGRSRK